MLQAATPSAKWKMHRKNVLVGVENASGRKQEKSSWFGQWEKYIHGRTNFFYTFAAFSAFST